MNDHQTTEQVPLYVWPFRDLLRKLGGPSINTLESMLGIDRSVVLSFGKVGYVY